MSIAVGIVMIFAAAAFVAAPLFNSEAAPELVAAPSRSQLERQKLDAYAAIKEAEFDYQMGKLSDADFTALRDKYASQALEAIATLESAQSARPTQITQARRPARIAFCPACGRGVPTRANFCPGCGRSLKELVA